MERHIMVMKHILELTDTMNEGLDYIQENIEAGYYQPTYSLLCNCVEAFFKIEYALLSFLSKLPLNRIELRTVHLRECFDQFVYYYESTRRWEAPYFLAAKLFPAFRSWKVEIDKYLGGYVLA